MFIIITLLLTVLVSGIFGAVPAVVSHRRVSRRDAAWAAGLWLAVWVFALCAYHRPGLTVGFHAFRLVALTAMTGWAGLVTAGLRSLGRKGLKAVVPLLAVTALGLEVFVGNVAYFNTHSYTPFQLVDYLDDNINVGRGVVDGSNLVDGELAREGHAVGALLTAPKGSAVVVDVRLG